MEGQREEEGERGGRRRREKIPVNSSNWRSLMSTSQVLSNWADLSRSSMMLLIMLSICSRGSFVILWM